MHILFLDTVHSILEERLTAQGWTCTMGTTWSREKVLEEISNFQGVVVRSRMPIDSDFFAAAKQLQFVARSGAGMENIDLSAAEAHNVTCFNAPEGNCDAVGEQAIAMLLALFNKIVTADPEVRRGQWNREANRGEELGGKTIGIIGYGNNGSAFARKLAGFNVRILAYDKYISGFGSDLVEEVQMETIFEHADVLSFHIPQTEETLGLFSDDYLNKFVKPIYLLNLARGKIVQTTTLSKGLQSGKVLGAGLDVLEYERASFEQLQHIPESLQALFDSPKVVLMPHVGGWTHASYFKLSNVLANKILAKFG